MPLPTTDLSLINGSLSQEYSAPTPLVVVFGIIVLMVACSSAGTSAAGAGGASAGASAAGASGLGASAGVSGMGVGGINNAGAGGVANTAGAAGANAGGAGAGGVNTVGGAAGAGGGAVVTCKPPADVFSPIEKLSQTGCVDPADPRKPSASAVSYEVNSPLWSDSADKQRAFVLPSGSTIHVRNCATNPTECSGLADDGRWDFPVGSVMIKIFMFDSKLVETRLFMHLDADNWVGYSYEWDEAQTDAKIVSTDRVAVDFNTGTRTVSWHYPSQDDCLNCHNRAGGSTLGPETAQMNRVVGGVNQIDKLASLGLFDTPPPKPYKAALVTPYAGQLGSPPADATTEQKARSYLHANCGFCHRPGGNQANFDLRNDVALKDMKICNADAQKGAIPSAPGKTKLMVPGQEMDSVLWLRMNQPDEDSGRMPQIASYQVDANAVSLVGDWIKSISACPQ